MDYQHLQEQLTKFGHDLVPAELQGMAYGFISMKGEKEAQALWARYLMEEFQDHIDNPDYTGLLYMFGQLFTDAQNSLESENFAINLCLPDDDHELHTRVEALGCWCKGFMYGLGLVGEPEALKEPEIQDALNDLTKMMGLAIDPSDPEEDERAFHELVEYVRLVPAMIYQHTQPEQKEETVH